VTTGSRKQTRFSKLPCYNSTSQIQVVSDRSIRLKGCGCRAPWRVQQSAYHGRISKIRRSHARAMLLLAIPQSARTAREKPRYVVQNLLLLAIDLVGVNAVTRRQFRHRRYLAQCLQGLALNVASNFLRDLVISILHRLRQSRTLHTLTFGPISGVHFTTPA
jgi:hypothetical protein